MESRVYKKLQWILRSKQASLQIIARFLYGSFTFQIKVSDITFIENVDIHTLSLLEWNASSEIASKVEAWSRRLARVGYQDNVDSIVIVSLLRMSIKY